MQPEGPIAPFSLSIKDLPWQIAWDKDKCTLCGRCTTSCPVNAIELGVFRKRQVAPAVCVHHHVCQATRHFVRHLQQYHRFKTGILL